MKVFRLFLLLSYFSFFTKAQTNFSSFVNPFIGTGGHGHTFPGAVMPFGMVQLSPDTRADNSWDGSSGYHYDDTLIYGFSHTHLSGTGVSDWGDILVMPFSGAATMDNKKYASRFSHKNEKASPGFYEVLLDKGNIKAELTVTPRTGIHRYTFPGEQKILIDLQHRDELRYVDIKAIDSLTVYGMRVSKNWAKDQHLFFVMKFSKPYKKVEYSSGRKPAKHQDASSTAAGLSGTKSTEGAFFSFDKSDGQPLLIKVGISAVGFDGALKNIEAEATHWDFEKYHSDAGAAWNKQLSKIETSASDANQLTTFYTALYHCSIHPSLYMDVDNRYRGRDNAIHTAEGFTNYTVFSLWDTYRALHPLFTLIEHERTKDFINSFLHQYKHSGRLPVWELSSNETDCMIGFHSVSVIADALLKGIGGFDTLEAYKAMKAAADYSAHGIPVFNKQGFLQADDISESVSRTLEYAYDNWCIGRVAALLGKNDDKALHYRRAQAYRHLFDDSTGFIRPRRNGGWLEPFDPKEINNHFTEANCWQYTFYVPHDIEGLIQFYGGKEKFAKKLDELFNSVEKPTGREQADVSGLLGQYAHGNEPSHHIAYLYNFAGYPLRSIERVRQIQERFYKNSPDGLAGNEDCGQMSAWHVFSSIGMYPVCPGSTQYILGDPLFKETKLNLENGKKFTIMSLSPEEGPLQSVFLSGTEHELSAIEHSVIMSGGNITFDHRKSGTARLAYGKGRNGIPPSAIDYHPIVPAPVIHSSSKIFRDTMSISIEMINTRPLIPVYSANGTEPSYFSAIYTQPLLLDSSCTIRSRVLTNGDFSPVTTARFIKLKNGYNVVSSTAADGEYTAEGPLSLIDGIPGAENWRHGDWLGFQGRDVEYVIDLGSEKEVGSVAVSCLQDSPAWILFPKKIMIYVSKDNKIFTPFGNIDIAVKTSDPAKSVKVFEKKAAAKVKARYVKVKALSLGKLPATHPGAGGESWIFIDEISVP